MSNKTYKTSRKYKCPYCDQKLPRMDLINHVERKHEALIPEDYTATRLVYDSINKTDHGTCMICKKPVYEWNEKISRYNNLCGSKKCREEVRRIALERHIRVHNTPTLLNDPTHQEKMLSNRHISGSYRHSDGTNITYTGKYEKAAVEFMDQVMNIPSKDIQMPGPILEYEYNGEKHSWITDIYYIPANLIIEVKDGGSNPNNRNMPEYRGKQYAKEVMITDLGKFNYLRLTNNDFSQLLAALADIKYENIDQKEAPQVKFYINESVRLIPIREEKSELDKDFKPKKKISLSSLKKIHITEEIIERYKKEYPVLKHVRCKDTKEYTCDGYMWMDDDKLVCYVGSCQYNDDHTKWIVSLEIIPEYRGHGLSKQILDFCVKTMKCKYLSVNKNNKIAKHIYDEYGFKVYQEDKSMYYMCYGVNTVKESFISNEEVGGLPPRRATANWIEPCMVRNTGWETIAIGNDISDTMFVGSMDDEFKKITKEEYRKDYERAGESLIYNGDDSTEIFKKLMNGVKTITEAMNILAKPFRCLDELALRPNWYIIDRNKLTLESAFIENAILRENDIVAGSVNLNDTDTVIKGAVMLSYIPDKGYFIHTPNDYHLASEYYGGPEDIPQNLIDTMADLYDQYKQRGENNE